MNNLAELIKAKRTPAGELYLGVQHTEQLIRWMEIVEKTMTQQARHITELQDIMDDINRKNPKRDP